MKRMCENCLEVREDVRACEVGPDKGHQRDPYRERYELCVLCKAALVDRHDLKTFAERYQQTRTVTLDRKGDDSE